MKIYFSITLKAESKFATMPNGREQGSHSREKRQTSRLTDCQIWRCQRRTRLAFPEQQPILWAQLLLQMNISLSPSPTFLLSLLPTVKRGASLHPFQTAHEMQGFWQGKKTRKEESSCTLG